MPDAFIEGIDVSSNQGQVDWAAVLGAGKAFAFARATVGGHQADPRFSANWQNMSEAGILRGAYHFFWPLTPWQDQATNFMDTVGALSKGDLPPVLDLEEAISKSDPLKRDAWKDIPANQRLSIIQNWLTQVEQGLGLRPMIYTRQNFIELLLGDSVSALATCPLWIAHYQVPAPSIPPKWTSWTFWQYSETGGVDGEQGNVDCDRFSGSLNDLQGLTKS